MNFTFRFLFDTNFVVEKLKNNEIPQWISFLHFFIIMSFDWLQFTFIALNENKVTTPSIFSSLSTFILTVVGLLYLYRCNGGKDGRYFLERFFALSISVGWKFVIGSFLLTYVINFFLNNDIEWIQVLAFFCLNLGMFLQIGKNIRLIDSLP